MMLQYLFGESQIEMKKKCFSLENCIVGMEILVLAETGTIFAELF